MNRPNFAKVVGCILLALATALAINSLIRARPVAAWNSGARGQLITFLESIRELQMNGGTLTDNQRITVNWRAHDEYIPLTYFAISVDSNSILLVPVCADYADHFTVGHERLAKNLVDSDVSEIKKTLEFYDIHYLPRLSADGEIKFVLRSEFHFGED